MLQATPPPAVITPAPAAAPMPLPSPSAGAWIPSPRLDGHAQTWMSQHAAFVERAARGGIDVMFLGDSITDFFATTGADVWNAQIAPLGNVVDFGISGDRTQYVLWRVQNGELDGSGARVVVLMIGTNNLASAAPEDIVRGVAAILDTIRAKLPGATVVLNALLPRSDVGNPLRAKLADVNVRLARLADGRSVRWLDAGPGFLDPAGALLPGVMPDGLHPSAQGYAIWAAALRPALLDALGK